MSNSRFMIAYYWNMAGKLIFRSISIISSLILVRLLTPADFGIIAISTMVIGFFAVLSDAGINRYIVMHQNPTPDIYNRAFSLNILLRFFSFLLVCLAAFPIASQMQNSELVMVIIITAFASFLSAFRNVGLIKLEKELNFAPINKILVIAKVISTIVTLSLAYIYRSYYALIIGTLTIEVVTVLLSYVFSKYRPSLDFTFDKAMFSFSGFLLFRNIIAYSRSQIDILLVGKKFGEEALGGFSIARQFAILPQTEIIAPAMQPAFSALSALNTEIQNFHQKIFQTLFSTYLFLLPSAVGLYLLADSFVQVVLGPQWLELNSYIGVLAFLMIPFVTQTILNIAYDNLGKTSLSFIVDLFGLLSIIIVFVMFALDTVADFAVARVLVGFLSFAVAIVFAKAVLKIRFRKVLLLSAIPILGSGFMYLSLVQMVGYFTSPTVELLLMSAVGAAVYTMTVLVVVFALLKIKPRAWLLTLFPSALFVKLEKILRWKIPSYLLNN